jgi:glycosyltransferase involved in cell wall biosynthesis
VKTPLVSIIVPLYNKEKYILECLHSIAAQDFLDWECIIVDDGSEDDSVNLVKSFIKSTPGNWNLIRKNNGGPSSARNFGVMNSKGKLVAFLDSDDIWLPNKLSYQLSSFESSPNCLISLTDYVITESHEVKIRGVRSSTSPDLLKRWLNMRGFGGLVESTGLVRRQVFDEGVFFDEVLTTGEGLDFMLRVSKLGPFCVASEFLTIYRLSDGQLHKNETLIKKNSKILGEKYGSSPHDSTAILRDQEAYFALSALRKLSKIHLILEILGILMKLKLRVISMAGSLVNRNIRAILISSKTKKEISDVRAYLSSKIVKLG